VSDLTLRRLERNPTPALLVHLSRAGLLCSGGPESGRWEVYWGEWLKVASCYPLFDGSGWALLFVDGCGIRLSHITQVRKTEGTA